MNEVQKIPHYVKPALGLLYGGATLVRQASQSDEAIQKGGGYIYFTLPDGRAVGAVSGRWLIERGYVSPAGDDLFAGGSQTYQVARHG